MEQTQVMDFAKEIAVGFKAAKSYPPGHPVMEKFVNNTMAKLAQLLTELPEFSMYFFEKTIIFQDMRIDVVKNPAVLSLLETLRKNEINSLTFNVGIQMEDIKNLYEVLSTPKLKMRQYGDAATMLRSKGTEKVKINAVKFGVQTGTTNTTKIEPENGYTGILESIKKLEDLVGKGISMLDMKSKLETVTKDIGEIPKDAWQPYSESVAKILENLPSEHRIEILQGIELKPFVLKLFSNLNDETLVKLIVTMTEHQKKAEVKNVLNVLGKDKFSNIMPTLKEKIPDLYEYLAQIGLLLSEKMSSTISKDDLRISIRPYYNMLDSQNAQIREEGLRSLVTLADRFTGQKNYELVKEIVSRISLAIAQESIDEVIFNLIDNLIRLYQTNKAHNQDKLCLSILEPFRKIVGREELSQTDKKKIIKFFSETGNPVVLPMLFSFLWESGIYPDVRSAIVKFSKDAATEALLMLKDAEDYSLRMKLIDIIKNIGEYGIKALVDNLGISEWYVRRNIILILGEIGDKSVIDHMVPLLEDKEDRVRLELVKAFTKLEYEKGLIKALNDSSVEVKAEALRGLRKKISVETVQELLPLFKKKGDAIHIELLKIIAEKKITKAAESIAEFLQSLELRDDSTAQSLKELGVTTLYKLDADNIKILLKGFTLSKDKMLANLAVAALKRIT
ncbi:HEAT repeat domain-containing protein [candidate division WOR-3 bacterium]|nr:HEAT repeat domain-containing protein [candidate division WOR-3 bacterium]